MLYDIEISDDLLTIPRNAPRLTRQNAYSNLLEITYLNNYERSNQVLSLDTEVNIDQHIYRSISEFEHLNDNNLVQIKRCESDSEQRKKTESLNIKRINTF